MPPAGFLSTSLVVNAAVVVVIGWIRGTQAADGFWSTVGDATLPYVYYVALGVLCHPSCGCAARDGRCAPRSRSPCSPVAVYWVHGPVFDVWF